MGGLGGVANALLKYASPSDTARVKNMVARIHLDKVLTGTSTWPPCFDNPESRMNNNGPIYSDDDRVLIELLEPWLATARSVRDLPVLEILLSTLTPD
jgi:hypothetical protein